MARKPKKFDLERVFEVKNIAEEISAELLTTIGCETIREYDADKSSRNQWEDEAKEALALALQIRERKTTPWEGAANIKYPLLTLASIEFAARAYPEIVSDQEIVQCIITGEDANGEKAARAERISTHMSYQLKEEMPDWIEGMDKLFHVLPILGVCYKKTYYDVEIGRAVSELVMPFDLITDSSARSFERSRRKSEILRYYRNEAEEKFRAKLWRRIELEDASSTDTIINDRKKDESSEKSEAEGVHEFISSHRWWDLDGDGYEEPYIVTVHYKTHEVVRIEPRFYEDSISRDENGEILKIIPDEYYTEYIFIPSADDDSMGVGFGKLLVPSNEVLNTSINQALDSASLANMNSGFIAKSASIKGGIKSLKPNEWKMVDSSGDDLRKAIVPIPVHEPSRVGMQLIGMMIDSGEKLGSTTGPMSGQSPGSRTPSSSISQLIEQGTKVHSAIFRRIHRSMKKEFEKLYKLNQMYLADSVYFSVLDSATAQETGRNDYLMGDASDIRPNSDPSMMTDQQRVQKADTLVRLTENPTFGQLLDGKEVMVRYLKTLGISGVDELFKGQKDPDPQLLIEKIKLENDRERLNIKKSEAETKRLIAEATVLQLRTDAITKLAETEIAIPDDQYARAVEKFNAIKKRAKLDGQQSGISDRGMEGGADSQGDGFPPQGVPPQLGGTPDIINPQ